MGAHPVNSTGSVARVVVVAPDEISGPAASTGLGLRASGRSRDTFAALSGLGGKVELEVARDASSCLVATRRGCVDLVVLDRVDRSEARRVLDALRAEGPPVIVVAPEAGTRAALEAARDGAAECVCAGPDYAEALPRVVLEQLRHSRRGRGAEQRRRQELQRYTDGILEDLPCALVVLDCESRILTANVTAEELLDAGGSGLEGRQLCEWLAGDSEALPLIERTFEQGVRFRGAETVLHCRDGRSVPIGLACSPRVVEAHVASSRAGQICRGAVVVFQDLSEIKQLECQLMQTEKMASVGQLAAGVAHEINNPTGFIHANLSQMTEYLGDLRRAWERVADLQRAVRGGELEEIRAASDSLSEAAREVDLDFVQQDFAKAILESQDGAERIRHIVRDLRDFSRDDTEGFDYADVNQCVDATANIASTMMKHAVVLEKQYSALPKVRCYPAQLRQVFLNLLVNGYQAIEQRLAGSGGTGKIYVRSECRDDHVVISIRDTGAGIAPADLKRIFDPFFTTREVGAGSGLGLTTCYNIVQRHRGRIEVTSQVGEGTCFEVWLPMSGPEPSDG